MRVSSNDPAGSSDIQKHNLSLVMRFIALSGPCARTEIAAGTGLAHTSIGALVGDLLDRGLIEEIGYTNSGMAGRPRRLVSLTKQMAVIGAQLLKDSIVIAMTALDGSPLADWSLQYQASDGRPEAAAEALSAQIRLAADLAEHDSIGVLRIVIAVAGPVSRATHQVPAATDFGWGNVDLVALVAKNLHRLECPILLVNDGNAAALAEVTAMDEVRPREVVYIKSDTGVGGGIILDGHIHAGAHGYAGEIGHLPISFDGPLCYCGSRGCLVQYVGTEALLRARNSVPDDSGPVATLADLLSEVEAGRGAALKVLEGAGRALGAAVLASLTLVDMQAVILGGDLADFEPWLRPEIDAALETRVHLDPLVQIEVFAGTLGNRATIRGALELAIEDIVDAPTSTRA